MVPSRHRPLAGRPRCFGASGAVLGSLLTAATVFCAAKPAPTEQAVPEVTLFDPDANHIWNRTYACLFVRQAADGSFYGADTPDPLLWDDTAYLLEGSSHRRALSCLDEFLRTHAERALADPLKHAILQHDFWAVFDWAAARDEEDVQFRRERNELCLRLAEAIRRLALTAQEIRALPDNYSAAVAAGQFATTYEPGDSRRAFLPPELFRPDGPWVCLSAHLEEPTAIVHFTGRSRFLVFLRLPGPRAATLEYLEKLRASGEPPLVPDSSHPPSSTLLNQRLPQFPVGTQVALVRQMILIDREGKLMSTPLTDLIELRGYHAVTPGSRYMNYINGPASRDQDFFEIRMRRKELFAGHFGGLVAVHPGELDYPTFATHGMDPFDSGHGVDGPAEILRRCLGCHSDSGIHSVQSRTQWMQSLQVSRKEPQDRNLSGSISWETEETIARKQRQPEFLLLERMWNGAGN